MDEITIDAQPHNIVTGVAQNAVFEFTMPSGENSLVAGITLDAPSRTGYVYLLDDLDNYVGWAEIVDSEAIVYSAPLGPGDYRLYVDPWGGFSGTVTVVPSAVGDQVETGAIGTPELMELTTPGQNFRLKFSGSATDVVGVEIDSSDLEGPVTMFLVDPSGVVHAALWGEWSGDGHWPELELNATGTWEVWFVLYNGETGSATMTVIDEGP